MIDYSQPFDDKDAEGLVQVLAAFNGTLPEGMEAARRMVAERPDAIDRAVAQMHAWRTRA